MPHFRLETNIPRSAVTTEFLKETTAVIAKALGKPRSYCVASVIPDLPFVWDESDAPAGCATLLSIGQLGVEANKKIAKALFAHIEKNLKIPPSRLYITFIDEKAANVGHNGTTFHEIFGGGS